MNITEIPRTRYLPKKFENGIYGFLNIFELEAIGYYWHVFRKKFDGLVTYWMLSILTIASSFFIWNNKSTYIKYFSI